MDSEHFDRLTSLIAATGSRRRALHVVAAAFGMGGISLLGLHDAEARRRKRKKKKDKGNQQNPTIVPPPPPPPPPAGKGVRAVCTPGVDTCASGLQCDAPTEDHTCSSTVGDVENWCCVPPGGTCNPCNCCGNFYCMLGFGDTGTCEPIE